MKELLKLMAAYNQKVDRDLFDLIEKADSALVTAESGSYFGNLLGILNHLLVSDLGWFCAYRDSNLDLPVLASPVLEFQHPGWAQNLYPELPPLRDHQERMDALFIDFIDETPAALFEGDIEVSRPNGRRYTFPFGKLVLHLLNHRTHHRGAISQILDENGVENDYSNLMRMFM